MRSPNRAAGPRLTLLAVTLMSLSSAITLDEVEGIKQCCAKNVPINSLLPTLSCNNIRGKTDEALRSHIIEGSLTIPQVVEWLKAQKCLHTSSKTHVCKRTTCNYSEIKHNGVSYWRTTVSGDKNNLEHYHCDKHINDGDKCECLCNEEEFSCTIVHHFKNGRTDGKTGMSAITTDNCLPNVPTATPTPAPTSYPTRTPTKTHTLAPTPHPCSDGSHSCHTTGGICYAHEDGTSGYTCACKGGWHCVAGCNLDHAGHTCVENTEAPTPAPGPVALTDSTIKTARDLWFSNQAACIAQYGHISDWDTSQVTNMGELFCKRGTFNEDISKWDTSQVTNMRHVFYVATAFNGDVSKWDTSQVTNMRHMFQSATAFNGDLSKWDLSKVTSMDGMFRDATVFNGDLSKWDTSNVKYMGNMFWGASAFNGDVSKWDTSQVTTMRHMFQGATVFNGDLSKWDTSKVWNMISMFRDATVFNGDVSKWDTSTVTFMADMFQSATVFNGDLSKWDTSKVTYMRSMFQDAKAFNGGISKWDTSQVTTMQDMFRDATAFNQDLSKWDIRHTRKTINSMFIGANAMADSNKPGKR